MTNHTKLSKGAAGALNNKVFNMKVLLIYKDSSQRFKLSLKLRYLRDKCKTKLVQMLA